MTEKAHILIVDDEEIIRSILKKLLLTMGHEVTTASGSEEALALIEQQRPDIILLDIVLPGDNSMSIVQAVRQPHKHHTAIVMISGHDNLDTMAKYIQAGADDFLLKPFNATLFRARVGRILTEINARKTIRQLQSRLAESELKLHMAEQAQETFCSKLSHDLNNSLTGIMMSAEMALMEELPETTVHAINEIIQSSDEINAIIKSHRAAIGSNPDQQSDDPDEMLTGS
ncbi:response regulator [Mariprofundus ferrooxydans]|uniref:response regulator n=1 Tax=Mariprofundus ferrooxydans TaxID=314344 RepID=UPI000373B332|nr:response regulator [Mariprofundus ferrooxydans]